MSISRVYVSLIQEAEGRGIIAKQIQNGGSHFRLTLLNPQTGKDVTLPGSVLHNGQTLAINQVKNIALECVETLFHVL